MNAIQTTKTIMTPVFVNTWGNYNRHGANGGRWLTLPMEPEELETQLAELAAAMGDHDPEFCIHDIDAVTQQQPRSCRSTATTTTRSRSMKFC